MYDESLLLEKELKTGFRNCSFTAFYESCHTFNTINCYTEPTIKIKGKQPLFLSLHAENLGSAYRKN